MSPLIRGTLLLIGTSHPKAFPAEPCPARRARRDRENAPGGAFTSCHRFFAMSAACGERPRRPRRQGARQGIHAKGLSHVSHHCSSPVVHLGREIDSTSADALPKMRDAIDAEAEEKASGQYRQHQSQCAEKILENRSPKPQKVRIGRICKANWCIALHAETLPFYPRGSEHAHRRG